MIDSIKTKSILFLLLVITFLSNPVLVVSQVDTQPETDSPRQPSDHAKKLDEKKKRFVARVKLYVGKNNWAKYQEINKQMLLQRE